MSCPLAYSLSVSGDCGNTNSGAFSLDIFGTSAFTITWISPALGVSVLPGNNYTVTGLSGGSYVFQITDSCAVPSPQTQTIPVNISTGTCVSVTGLFDTTCGLDNGSINVTTSNYYGVGYFDLYKQGDGLISSITAYSQSYTFSNLSSGFYYVVANDGGGCTGRTETCIIKSSMTLNYGLYVVNDSPCIAQTGAIYVTGLTGTPPYTYIWSNSTTNNFITGLTSGLYSVTVTDSLGCELTLSGNVANAPALGVASITSVNPSCNLSDGSATVYLTGGTGPFFYSGSNGETVVTFSDTYTFTGLSSQVFSVFVQDAGFCTATGSATLTTPNSFFGVTLSTTNSTCNGFGGQLAITLIGTPGNYTYSITDSSGNTISSTVPSQSYTFTGLYTGNYTITITNSGPCSFIDTFTINNSDLFTLSTLTTGTTCGLSNGSVTVDITGTYTGPYTFEIPGQAYTTGLSSFTFNNLSSGSYIATVTDSGACAQTVPFTILSSSPVDFILSSTNSTNGSNGQITAFITNGTPPFTLNWSSNVNGQTGYTVTSLSAGTYTLQVTDTNGCTMIRSVIVNGFSKVTASSDYNVSDGDVQLTGQNQRTGPEQMLIDGFYELTTEDYNCILNKAIFQLITEVDGITKSKNFYTGTTLTSYPDDVTYAQALQELLLSYPIIEDVQIDTVGNKIRIQTDCSVSEDVDGLPIKAYLKISNDISCQICGMKQFQDLENFYFMDGEPYFFMSQ